MQKRLGLLILLAIVGGILFNVLGFWEQNISSFLFVAYMYAVFFVVIQPKGILSKMGIFLMAWVMIIAFMKGIYMSDWLLPFSDLMITLGFIASAVLLSNTYTENRWNIKIVQDIGWLFLRTPLKLKAICQDFAQQHLQRLKVDSKKDMKSDIIKVFLGVVIAIPIIAILYLLLSSADPIFKDIITANIPNIFDRLDHLPTWFNGANVVQFVIVTIATISFSYQIYTHQKGKEQAVSTGNNNWLNSTTAATILIIMNLIYFVFCYVQIRYFFGSSALPEGFTYAEYAVQGFWQLVLINLINIGTLLLMTTSVSQTKFIKTLLTIIFVCTAIIFASGYGRMHLYLSAYGFSYERILSLSFMFLVGIWILISFIKVFYQRFKVSQYYIAIFLLYYLIVNILNIDKIVVNHNVERYHETGKMDFAYLASSVRIYETLPKIEEFKTNPEFLKELENRLALEYNDFDVDTACSNAWYQTNLSCNKYEELARDIVSRVSGEGISR